MTKALVVVVLEAAGAAVVVTRIIQRRYRDQNCPIRLSHQYADWKRTYGPLIHLDAMGTHLVIINDQNIAIELLDKRGSNYSDRPHMTMASELIGWNRPLILRRYDDVLFKEIRRCFSQLFGTRQHIEEHVPIFENEAHFLMKRIVEKPGDFEDYIHKCAAAIAMRIAYGYRPSTEGKDHIVDVASTAMRQADQVFTMPYLVDIIPWIKYVPEWFPGAGFKKVARLHRKTLDEMCDLPYRITMKRIREGSAEPSFVQRQVDEGDYESEKEELTRWAATTMYGGGIDTIVSSVSTFFLAMTMFPHVFHKARAEIDAVIGRDRLPTLADRPRLPYISAIQREVLRWNPGGPLGIPHSTLEDDVFGGYLIPKGSIVLANLWHILNDPEVYKNPRDFNPERFLASPERTTERDSHDSAFGFGRRCESPFFSGSPSSVIRRACPGKNLADATIFLEIALAAAVLDISRARDAGGKEILPDGKFNDGLVTHPLPYSNDIKTRDAQAEALIQAATTHI
ncbi:cytochrome P450 [Peniophora sp. CONT]|nr:cytochrome P450 [Peniophora sp. CONT]